MNNVSKKRERAGRFCTFLGACGQFSDHTRLDGPGSRREKEGFLFFFFFFFPLLSILEKLKMICQRQWYKATWWMGLSYSASQSFTPSFAAILSASFLWGKPLFPSPLHISAKFAVSVHAWPKGRKSHSVGVEFHFLARTYCFLWFARGVELQCDILFFFLNGSRTI